MRHRVLSLSLNAGLLETRSAILTRLYEVANADHQEQALTFLRSQQFHLILVCYTLGLYEAGSFIKRLKAEFPKLCVVRLLLPGSPEIASASADAIVLTNFDPELWLKELERLLP